MHLQRTLSLYSTGCLTFQNPYALVNSLSGSVDLYSPGLVDIQAYKSYVTSFHRPSSPGMWFPEYWGHSEWRMSHQLSLDAALLNFVMESVLNLNKTKLRTCKTCPNLITKNSISYMVSKPTDCPWQLIRHARWKKTTKCLSWSLAYGVYWVAQVNPPNSNAFFHWRRACHVSWVKSQ